MSPVDILGVIAAFAVLVASVTFITHYVHEDARDDWYSVLHFKRALDALAPRDPDDEQLPQN